MEVHPEDVTSDNILEAIRSPMTSNPVILKKAQSFISICEKQYKQFYEILLDLTRSLTDEDQLQAILCLK